MRLHQGWYHLRRLLRRAFPPTCARPRRQELALEILEPRTVLSAHLQLNGAQTLVAYANVNVSNDPTTIESEMTIAINHANPLNIAGFTHEATTSNAMQLFYSRDGGATWARTLISGTGTVNSDGQGSGIRFDPTVRFTDNGDLFVAYGAFNGSNTKLMVAKSTD